MRVNEYLSSEQKIDSRVTESGHYRNFRTISIYGAGRVNPFIEIFVARPGKREWSFGWNVMNSTYSTGEYKQCSSSSIMRGDIDKLLYGVMKRILVMLERRTHCSFTETKLALNQNIRALEKQLK